MQVVQRLVTLRDKLSGPDEGVGSDHQTVNGIGSSLATCAFIDGPAVYTESLNLPRKPAVDDAPVAPSFRLIMTFSLGLTDALATAMVAPIIVPDCNLLIACLIAVPLVLATAHLCGLYTIDSASHARRCARSALAVGAVVAPMAGAIAWLAAGEAFAGQVALGLAFGISVGVAVRAALATLIGRVGERLAERVLLVGECEAAKRVLDSRHRLPDRVRVVGQIVVGNGQPCVRLIGRICTRFEDDGEEVTAPVNYPTKGIDRVVIVRAGLDDQQLAAIARHLEAVALPVHVLMELPGGSGATNVLDNLGWVLRDRPISHASMIAKRGVDLALSGVALLFLAPLMLTIGALVRLDSPGPALFRQTRLGRGNEPFTVFKFRTMRADAPATDGSVQATRGDARVTRIGALLRKTSIDELPQLLNVLNGSMSLVGPRPHPTELNKKFMPLIESYAARHRIAPGITGWAQVNGFRGETRTVEQMQRRVELDLEYIRNRSVAFDLWILLRTVVSVFAHRNAAY